MVLQAYIDDSYDAGDGAFVLAGFISSAERWAAFSSEWEKALPKWGRLHKNGHYHFHMVEMAAAGQMEKVAGLYRIIEDHVQLGLSASFLKADIDRAKARVHVPGIPIDWGFLDNYYMIAYRALMDMFHNNRNGVVAPALPPTEKVDFYFDVQSEQGQVLSSWEDYIAQRDEGIGNLYGNAPVFRHDYEFLPLQAADFYAWWVRRWVAAGSLEDRLEDLKFQGWEADPFRYPRLQISLSEDDLVQFIISEMRKLTGGAPVIDLKGFVL